MNDQSSLFLDRALSGGLLDIAQVLGEREVARPFSEKTRDSGSLPPSGMKEDATAAPRPVSGQESVFVLRPPPQSAPNVGISEELVFEGTVIAVDRTAGVFTARLLELTGCSPEEEGEFSLAELNGDEYLAVPGALFTWIIGLQRRGGTLQRGSDIRFRRLPSIPKETIAKAEDAAAELADFFTGQNAREAFTTKIR